MAHLQRTGRTYTFNPRPTSSVYNFNIVPLLPPTPAALVPAGRAFAAAFFCSAARRLQLASETNSPLSPEMVTRSTYRMRVLAPPGGSGELGLTGVDGGEDYALN